MKDIFGGSKYLSWLACSWYYLWTKKTDYGEYQKIEGKGWL